ncbi:Tyrosinase ustQ [Paramyrothecium foliicola]|nr:Tyrosinase ustQ [Paramyrothecium foliicola]
MRYFQALAVALGLVQATAALPADAALAPRQATCASPRLRKSWDAATASEKKAYITAAVCLTKKPSKLGHAASTIHDDFSWVHNKLNSEIHSVAAFLPWHRLFVHTYEQALRTECGYTGTALYWDWVKDSGAPASASVWNPATGFGGNGVSADGSAFSYCVPNGPFAQYRPTYWVNNTQPHCLQRAFRSGIPQANLQEMLGYAYDEDVIAGVFLYQDFLGFHTQLEFGPHSAVHTGIAGNFGDMGPPTSPNDPIFYLVHAKVDQIWWTWQQQSASRLTDYAGNRWPEGLDGMSASLGDSLRLLGLGADKKVRDVMNTKNAELCYRY